MTPKHRATQRSPWADTIMPVLWLLVAALLIGGALGASTPHADATPATPAAPGQAYAESNAVAVCLTIDSRPTVQGLIGVLQAVQTVGHLTPDQAGEAVALSVLWVCPIHRPLLVAFVDAYRNAPARAGVSV